jgi:hypothetical protein
MPFDQVKVLPRWSKCQAKGVYSCIRGTPD